MVLDSEKIMQNALQLLKKDPRALQIVRQADGIRTYREIAKITGIHEKTTSAVLATSADLGFTEKVRAGVYKKVKSTVKLIPKKSPTKEANVDLHKQLEKISKKQIKISSIPSEKFIYTQKSEEMAKTYLWLYIVENTYRKLVRKAYQEIPDWWNQKVGKTIRDEVEESIRKYPYDAPKRIDELDYTTLQQLSEIIGSKTNWNDFINLLKEKDRKVFLLKFKLAFPFRNATGHCISMNDKELKSMEVKFGDLLDMIIT